MRIKNKLKIFLTIIIFLVVNIFGAPRSIAGTWTAVGSEFSGYYPIINFNPANHEPYVAAGNFLKKYNGTSWENVGTGLGDFIRDFDFNPITAEPYAVFDDQSNDSGGTVVRFDGNYWVDVGNPDVTAGTFNGIDLAFDPQTGEPYVAYVDDNYTTHIISFNGSSWSELGMIKNTAVGDAYSIRMAFAPSTDEVYVAFTDRIEMDSSRVTVSKFNGTSWENVGEPRFSSDIDDEDIDIVFNPSTNEPYIAFSDESFMNKVTVMRYNGGVWQSVGAPGFSGGSAAYINMKFDPVTHEPYISFFDFENERGRIERFYSGTWESVFDETSASVTSFAFSPLDDKLFTAYQGANSAETVDVYEYSGDTDATPPTAPTGLLVY